MGFVEIHFHLLPGVDDGPQTLLDAVDLARMAARDGTRTIVTTPHVNSNVALDVSTVPARVREVAGRLRRERIPVRLWAGGELAHDMVERLAPRELEDIAQGPPGNRWLLLEAPLSGLDERFTAAADELRGRGFGVVVAHPERSLTQSAGGWRAIEHELQAGSAMRLTAWSIAGLHGAVGLDVERRWRVELSRPCAVSCLPDREQFGKHPPIAGGERGGDVEKGVRQRTHEFVGVQVIGTGHDVTLMRLEPFMIVGRDPEAEYVYGLRFLGEPRRQFLGKDNPRLV